MVKGLSMGLHEKLFEKHIEYVEAVNCAKDKDSERDAANTLYGFREALEIMGINQLIECDLYYIGQGIERPMCAGIFLD